MSPSKDKKLPLAEQSLFRDAVADAKPIKQKSAPPFRQKPPPRPLHPRHDDAHYRDGFPSDRSDFSHETVAQETPETLLFHRPGLRQTTVKKLRKGQIGVEAELDLHGFTVPEAGIKLTQFIHFAMEHRLRCVKVIHGKGKRCQSILKQQVNHWLQQREEVLAFSSATARDGGTGAIYLLLRRIDRLKR